MLGITNIYNNFGETIFLSVECTSISERLKPILDLKFLVCWFPLNDPRKWTFHSWNLRVCHCRRIMYRNLYRYWPFLYSSFVPICPLGNKSRFDHKRKRIKASTLSVRQASPDFPLLLFLFVCGFLSKAFCAAIDWNSLERKPFCIADLWTWNICS